MEIEFIGFKKQYEKDFHDLNIDWLKTYFVVEEYDKNILLQSKKYIIDKGGYIFFAKLGKQIVGTIAFLKTEREDIFELTKMSVKKNYRGLGIGNFILKNSLNFAKINNFKCVILYSNRKLKNAIYLYKKYGFKDIDIESNSPYHRADIKMEKII